MRSESAIVALVEIRFNIALVTNFLGVLSSEAYADDLKSQYAVVRALQIISEASRRLPSDLKADHPEIMWREMQNAGNKYRHEYDGISASRIWETATQSPPPLLTVVESELAGR